MGSELLKQQLSARSKKELKFCSPSSQVNTPTLTPRALDAIFSLAPPAATVTSLSHRNEEEITATAYLTWNTEFSYCERHALKHNMINSLVLLQGNPPYPNEWQVCSSLSALEYQGEVLGNKRGHSMRQSMTVATMLDSYKVSKPEMDKILKIQLLLLLPWNMFPYFLLLWHLICFAMSKITRGNFFLSPSILNDTGSNCICKQTAPEESQTAHCFFQACRKPASSNSTQLFSTISWKNS